MTKDEQTREAFRVALLRSPCTDISEFLEEHCDLLALLVEAHDALTANLHAQHKAELVKLFVHRAARDNDSAAEQSIAFGDLRAESERLTIQRDLAWRDLTAATAEISRLTSALDDTRNEREALRIQNAKIRLHVTEALSPPKNEMIEFLRDKATGLRNGSLLHGTRAEQTRIKNQMRQDADMLDRIAETLRQSATVN